MSINYRADYITLPSVRGVGKIGGVVGTTSDVVPATKKDATNGNQNFNLDDLLLHQWVTFQANGCTIWLLAGATTDTVTASATGPGVRLDSGVLFHARITKATQQIGYISTGSFTAGLLYWPSARND